MDEDIYSRSVGDGKVGLHNAWRMMDLGNKEKVSNFETLCNLRSKYNSIKKDIENRSRTSEKANSKNQKRKSAISGTGTRFNIMQSLKDIDEKILGPEGKKDTGVKLNDKDFLNGFLEGFNDTQEEVFHRKILVCLGICTLLVSVFLTTYYIMFYLDVDVTAEY